MINVVNVSALGLAVILSGMVGAKATRTPESTTAASQGVTFVKCEAPNTCHECNPNFSKINASTKTSTEFGNVQASFDCTNAPVPDGWCDCDETSPAPVTSTEIDDLAQLVAKRDLAGVYGFLASNPAARLSADNHAVVLAGCKAAPAAVFSLAGL